jgi:hypothetical protein
MKKIIILGIILLISLIGIVHADNPQAYCNVQNYNCPTADWCINCVSYADYNDMSAADNSQVIAGESVGAIQISGPGMTSTFCDGHSNYNMISSTNPTYTITCGTGECKRSATYAYCSDNYIAGSPDYIDDITCSPGTPGTVELCNGKDDNCDGQLGPSENAYSTGTEVCDGMDNNCNGQVDEGFPLATCGVGACARTGSSCLPSSCTPGTPSP